MKQTRLRMFLPYDGNLVMAWMLSEVKMLTFAVLRPLTDKKDVKSNNGSWHSLRLHGRDGQ